MSDMELLRDYDRQGSEEAFAELVRRQVGLVYSAALRQVGVAAHAEEITQAVFVILARKAAGLRPGIILESWLYETTRLTSLSFLRAERRRQRREQEAYMQSTLQESNDSADWNQLAPLLDEAMERLGQKERDAVVLRFFKQKNVREVAMALEVSEAVAQKRVHRAVEKLRLFFSKRGVALSGVVISGVISANSIQAAPAALAHSVTVAAITKGTAASGSTLTLIKGALKIMAWTKAKIIVTASVAVLLATGTTVVVVEKVGLRGVNESFWKLEGRNLDKAPPVVIIRPSRYSDSASISDNGNGKTIVHQTDFTGILQEAYSSRRSRMVLPADLPQGQFDLMLTLPGDPKGGLRREIQVKFGFIGRHQSIETNVLLLRVKDPNRLAASRSKLGSQMRYKPGPGTQALSNFPITWIIRGVEGDFQLPIIVQAGCAGNFDVTLKRPNTRGLSETVSRNQRQQAIREQLENLGLELVPATTNLEMVVVEKVTKNAVKDMFFEPLAESDYAPRNDSALQGTWRGTVVRDRTPMEVSLRIAERAENTFRAEADVLAMQQTNLHATAFSFSRPQVIIEFGELISVMFEGNLSDDGREIKGTVSGQGEVSPLTFKRVEN